MIGASISITNIVHLLPQGGNIVALINSFKSRVSADGGVFEAEACLNAVLTNLNNI